MIGIYMYNEDTHPLDKCVKQVSSSLYYGSQPFIQHSVDEGIKLDMLSIDHFALMQSWAFHTVCSQLHVKYVCCTGLDAITLCCANNHSEMALVLIAHGASPDATPLGVKLSHPNSHILSS